MNAADLSAAVLSLVTILLIVGSFWFWGVFFRNVREGRDCVPLRFRWKPVRVPRFAVVLTLTLIAMYFQASASLPKEAGEMSVERIRLLVLGTLGEGVLVLGILLPALFLGARSRPDLIRLGMRCDQPGQQLKAGLLGLVAVVIPMGIVLLLTSPIRGTETEHPFLKLLRETGAGNELLLIVLSAVVIAPLKEELMFRVVLQSWLEEFCPPGLAVTLAALTFAAIHGFPDSLALLPLAVGLGILYQKRRSYLAVVSMHALFNAYNVTATIVGSQAM